MKSKLHSGFTLVELLLSMAIISVLTFITAPVVLNSLKRSDLDVTYSQINTVVYRARELAKGGYYDDSWSVRLSSGQILIYKGSSYSSRDSSYDESYTLPNGTNVSGDTDFNFSKLNGDLSSTKNINISNSLDSVNININTKGLMQ